MTDQKDLFDNATPEKVVSLNVWGKPEGLQTFDGVTSFKLTDGCLVINITKGSETTVIVRTMSNILGYDAIIQNKVH
jgi:hypothetical protein